MNRAKPVPWSINVPPEVQTEYVGTKLAAYFTDAAVMFDTQQQARAIFMDEYGIDIGGVHVDPPCYVGVQTLGADLVFPEDEQPMIRNQGHVLGDPQQVDDLEVPDPYESELFRHYLSIYDYMKAQAVPPARIGFGSGQMGPVSAAVILRGERFLEDLHTAPGRARRLLEITTGTEIRFAKTIAGVTGIASERVGFGDDFAGLLPPAMWPEFVVPYWARVYETLGASYRTVHSELLHKEHLRFLQQLEIELFDPGMDQYLSVRDIIEEVDLEFTWNIFTSRDMLQGTPESICALYLNAVAAGAPRMTVELCRGVPRENVLAFLDIARELCPQA